MEITQEELKAQLMQSNEEFRDLVLKHDEYKKRVIELEAMAHPSEEEMQEEARLKKLKLHIKDQMAEIINRHTVQTVS
ncbi:MAG: YdcH family protein [Bryobacterales bacterium]|nr:YdcH family protein [Bryobacterales bacterium]